ncbi:MAG: CARDB domain-containing protein [Pirellulaceae bacterium]|jgi:uncharacterized repeat protein (TIGR01451 family)|nr:CARDB domain-containing protein [Pirellulaceae bacterium]
MSRKAITAVALLFVCGVVVAVVRAQDDSGSYPIDAGGSSIGVGDDRAEQSVLVDHPPTRTGQQDSDPGESSGTPTTQRRTGLADRLRQVRESATRGDESNGGRFVPDQLPKAEKVMQLDSTSRELESSRFAARPAEVSPARAQASSTTSSRRSAPHQGAFSSTPPTESPTRQPIPMSVSAPASQEVEPRLIPSQPFEGPMPRRQPIDLDGAYDTPSDGQIQLSSSGPALRIDTVGPRSILIGKEASYTLTLSNLGSLAAKDVFVRVELPEWVDVIATDASAGIAQPQNDESNGQRLIWNVSQLSAEGQETLRLSVIPTKDRNFGLAIDWTVRPETSLAQIVVQRPQLELSVFGPKDILYGETAVYTIQLTNPGTGDADDVSVDFSYGAQNLPTKRVGTLAAGAQTEISVELTSRQAGTLPVSAIAIGGNGLRAEASEEVLVRRANLELTVAGSQRKFAGGVGTYEIRVRNTGNATASGVLAKVLLPDGAKFIAGGDLTPANQGMVKRVGPLAPGAERVFAVQCQLTAPGDNRLEVHAESESELAASASFVTRVDALADLKLQVNDPQGPTAVGTKANYEITIENRGTKAAEDIKVVAQFSDGVEPVRAQGAVAEIVPGQVLFQTIPRIGPGDQIKLTIVAVADRAGNHRFRVETTSTEPETRLVAEESTHFFGDDVAEPQR